MSTGTLETVQTAEDARKLFAARAYFYRSQYGNRVYVDSALKHLGLDRYLGNADTVYRVKTARLLDALGETIDVRVPVPVGYGSLQGSGRVQGDVNALVTEWVSTLTDEDFEVLNTAEKIDVSEWNERFGAQGQLPPAASDEVTATWRELVDRSLAWADREDICDQFETALTRMGFREFLPPREMDVEAVIDGVTLRVERVEANRMGYRGKGVSPEAFATALYHKLRRNQDLQLTAVASLSADNDDADNDDDA